MGKTTAALSEARIQDASIFMDASKVATALKKHTGLDKSIIAQIPELLADPVIVIDSKSDSDSRIVMGDLTDLNNKTVTVVLKLTTGDNNGIKISSAEGRGHIQSLFIKDDGSPVTVRYTDKKRIQNWLSVNKVQSPLRSFSSDSPVSGIPLTDNTIARYSDISQEENENFSEKSSRKLDGDLTYDLADDTLTEDAESDIINKESANKRFVRQFSGEVRSAKRRLSKQEAAMIRAALKRGDGRVDNDLSSGWVFAHKYFYTFWIANDGVDVRSRLNPATQSKAIDVITDGFNTSENGENNGRVYRTDRSGRSDVERNRSRTYREEGSERGYNPDSDVFNRRTDRGKSPELYKEPSGRDTAGNKQGARFSDERIEENSADFEKVRKSAEETPEKVRNIPERVQNEGKTTSERVQNEGEATARRAAAKENTEAAVKKRGGRNAFRKVTIERRACSSK